MGKIRRHGGATVRQYAKPRTAADVLRERGKLGPYDGAKVDTFTPDEAVDEVHEHPGTGEPGEPVEATPDGTEHELVVDEPARPRKRTTRPRKTAGRSKAG